MKDEEPRSVRRRHEIFESPARPLEESVQQLGRFPQRRAQGWFMILLGEAYLLAGDPERARELAVRGLALTTAGNYRFGMGRGQRTLGRIAMASDTPAAAQTHFCTALKTYEAIHAEFEAGRTCVMIAIAAHTQGRLEEATAHLKTARQYFAALDVAAYVERTDVLARRIGGAPLQGEIRGI